MDTFIEQLVTIKKTGKTWAAYFGIALAAIILMTVSFLFFKSIFIALDALIFFGAYKLYSMLSIEYEYIITNSTMDIDKIIAKSSRKRTMSFELPTVQRIEKYRVGLPEDLIKDAVFACNGNEDNAYVLVIHPEGKGKQTVVIAPDERLIKAMKTFLPKFVADTLN